MVSRPSNCHVVTLGTLWNMQDTVQCPHRSQRQNGDTTFSMTLWLGVYIIIIISSNDTTETTNTTRRLPSCVSSQCQNNEINQIRKCRRDIYQCNPQDFGSFDVIYEYIHINRSSMSVAMQPA